MNTYFLPTQENGMYTTLVFFQNYIFKNYSFSVYCCVLIRYFEYKTLSKTIFRELILYKTPVRLKIRNRLQYIAA